MDADDLILARIAQNQSTFRAANENIDSVAGRSGVDGQVPLICECADDKCFEIIRLGLDEYEAIRRYPRRFFNAPGHERASQEAGADVVVEERAGCVIVEKIGAAGAIAAGEANEREG